MNPTNSTQPRPRVWGHRGAMAQAPQNTLPSFLLAHNQGADGIELDVQLTKDGVPVVFHDASVDVLTDGRGPLASLTWAQVKALDAGVKFGRGWAGTRIPTLEAVLEALPAGLAINVELKTSLSEEAWWDRWLTLVRGPRTLGEARRAGARAEVDPLAAAVAALLSRERADRIVVSSFDPFALEAFGARVPHLPLGFLHSPTVPWDTPALVEALPYRAWHPHHSQVTAPSVVREHAAGRKVHVWTVNDPAHAVALARMGVDAVITNHPGEVLKVLGG